ncbi:hypothetical protein JCM4814A_73500 [Streptomyces phaeofaciens JCM 4814]|uniref:Uncharacterized protein n=1 Tax=Streptomyces phaeofaciens TaxID=68254 RepID=A0A918LXC8_9ACTN|nr:hypothetical protein [Streptomyces phaeofaciens]GGT62909.1 hypothetical protein GCM10010226_45960 [Streptomyces phaeofaciens]
MPLHLTIPQLAGLTLLALASVAWLIGMNRMLRRIRSREAALPGLAAPATPVVLTVPEVAEALPRPEEAFPHREAVELTPAEKDAFAGLVRQLDGGR